MEYLILDAIGDVIEWLFSQLWIWILIASVIVCHLLILLYRKLKADALCRMEYTRYFSSDGVFAGESFQLTEVVRNPTLFPLFFVNVEFFIPTGLQVNDVRCYDTKKYRSTFHIPPMSTAKRVHEVVSDKRDHYKMKNATVIYRKNEFNFEDPIEIYVYPNNFYEDADLSDKIRLAGDVLANKRHIEDPFFFSGIRRYVPGDGIRQVNFKASVRSFSGGRRQLMCNYYESSRNFDTMIFLDLTEHSIVEGHDKYGPMMERGLRCACYLFCQAERNGGRVGFISNCATERTRFVNIPCGTGKMHVKKVLECFAELSPYARHDYSINALLREAEKLPEGTDIYLLSAFVDEKTAELIRSLERKGRGVTVIDINEREDNTWQN